MNSSAVTVDKLDCPACFLRRSHDRVMLNDCVTFDVKQLNFVYDFYDFRQNYITMNSR